MERTKLLEIIKSGDFSVYYHDNGCSTIYQGKHDFDEVKDWDAMEKLIIFESEPNGYHTSDLELLVDALGGVIYSV